jgi:hypothetical protein
MDLGDLIDMQGKVWLVVRLDEAGNAYVATAEGTTRRVSDTLNTTDPDNCKVRCNPYRDWPHVLLPVRTPGTRNPGRVTGVALPNRVGDLFWLRQFQSWVVGEPLRAGGALLLRPSLRLVHPQRVVVKFEKGQTSVVIPKRFTTIARKGTDAQFSRVKREPKHLTAYDHLLGDTLGEDE